MWWFDGVVERRAVKQQSAEVGRWGRSLSVEHSFNTYQDPRSDHDPTKGVTRTSGCRTVVCLSAPHRVG